MNIYEDLKAKKKNISVTGLGYVGLPLALEFARHFKVVVFDINAERVEEMKQGIDPSNELDGSFFQDRTIEFTSNAEDLKNAHFHIIGVPTDVDEHKVPNLKPLLEASASVGKALKKGDYVVYESTVYPGCTEEDCLPILEKESGLSLANGDFKLGYSPERIVPGSKTHTLTSILKIISGSDKAARTEIGKVYQEILTGGIHETSSIKVAEAAKVIENTQRDLNISLMNELSIIFDMMDINTKEVIEAASTKWNFLKMTPGLVGGHCIGVDPYYLLYKAKQIGYDPQVILSGRRVNDEMPKYVAKRLVQMLVANGKNLSSSKVLILGITFKENVSDIRNSKVVEFVKELKEYGMEVQIKDPYASADQLSEQYELTLENTIQDDYDAVVVAVGHDVFLKYDASFFESIMNAKPILFDLKGIYARESEAIQYWSL